MTKENIIGIIAVVALIVGFIGWTHPTIPQSFGTTNNGGTFVAPGTVIVAANTTLLDGYQTPNPSVFDYVVSRGYLVAQNMFGLGNGTSVVTNQQAVRQLLTAATTTPCALQNPFSATSTIPDGVTLNITTATSSAGTITFATSTTAFATTTTIQSNVVLPASTQATYSIPTATNGGTIVGPGGWIVIGVAGISTTQGNVNNGFTYGGSCQATFQSAN